MTYYINLPDEGRKVPIALGEESFGSFYSDQGMDALRNLINKYPELIESVQIVDEKNTKLTITEFFDILSKLTIIRS